MATEVEAVKAEAKSIMITTNVKGRKCAVYQIKHKSGRVYVGSSVNVKAKIDQHKFCLLNQKHKNGHLQEAFNSGNESDFEVSILELLENKNELKNREQFYLDSLQSYKREFGFNISKDATGKTLSEETKSKMSKIAKDRPASYYDYAKNLYTGRPIPQEQRDKISNTLKGRKIPKGQVQKMVESRCRFIYTIMSPNGDLHETNNPSQFAKDNGLMTTHIYDMRDGKRKSTKGWKFIDIKDK